MPKLTLIQLTVKNLHIERAGGAIDAHGDCDEHGRVMMMLLFMTMTVNDDGFDGGGDGGGDHRTEGDFCKYRALHAANLNSFPSHRYKQHRASQICRISALLLQLCGRHAVHFVDAQA